MKNIILTLALLFLAVETASAIDRYETARITSCTLQPVDSTSPLPMLCYALNGSPSAGVSKTIIFMNTGDRLFLSVINGDTAAHGFKWTFETGTTSIPPGDTVTVVFQPVSSGAYPFIDGTNYPFNVARGLSGAVIVKDPSDNARDYVWFLNDHDVEWSNALASGGTVNASGYLADYFTINGQSFPNTTGDTLASVTGTVNEQINIWIINGGLLVHSMHFHGYHVGLLSRNGVSFQQPYSKDTFPVKQGEGFHTRLTPHQPGIFPVHDHILMSVTSKGVYPNGMLVLLNISQTGEEF